MANQSAAFGEVVISTKNKDDLKDFIYLQLLSEKNVEYDTTLLEVFDFGPIDKEKVFDTLDTLITKEEADYQVELRVNGTGYWCFRRNIEWFFEQPLTENYKDETINEIRNRLETVKFEAVFDIIDFEAGSAYIDNSIYKIESYNREHKLTTLEEEFYDYNAENLMKFEYCDWAIDKKYALENLEEFKKDAKDSELPQELLEDDERLCKVLSKLDDTIYTEFEEFIDQILENLQL